MQHCQTQLIKSLEDFFFGSRNDLTDNIIVAGNVLDFRPQCLTDGDKIYHAATTLDLMAYAMCSHIKL